MRKILFVSGGLILSLIIISIIHHGINTFAQDPGTDSEEIPPQAREWVDSVFQSMSIEEKIGQMVFIRSYSKTNQNRIDQVKQLIRKQKVGGITFFQGSPVRQAQLTNAYQKISKTPLFISIDAEWGLGMRLDSVIPFPHQMMLGAVPDSMLIYQVGKRIGQQCKRIGVQINFAPVVDINNNPDNPVINDRSFGENKYRVAHWGVQYMRGLQSTGVMAVAKHFPGHGDTDVDSHKSLPVVNKSMKQLQQLELFPFQQMINYGVKGVMTAHLEVPAIDKRAHRPMSVSEKAIDGLLKKKMGFQGLAFTDALEMKGVSGYYKNGRAGVEALKAGNDVLLLPKNVEACIRAIKQAVEKGEVQISRINKSVKKILLAKYQAGLNNWQPVETDHLTEDLNEGIPALTKELDMQAVTVLNNENHLLPFSKKDQSKIAVLTVGSALPAFKDKIRQHKKVPFYHFGMGGSMARADNLAKKLKKDFNKIIITVGGYHHYPSHHYGISTAAIQLIQQLQEEKRTATVAFGNPYAIQYFTHGPTIIAAYNASDSMQKVAADLLFGAFDARGTLPVTVSREFSSGTGLQNLTFKTAYLPFQAPEELGIDENLLSRIDSIAEDAIARGATPGCSILGMKDGKIFYQKEFGYFTYDKQNVVKENSIYDLASVTKVCATTVACMRLYDEGKLKLNGTLGDYLPWLRGTDKAGLTIKDVMLHQAGFKPDFSFSLFLTKKKKAKPEIFQHHRDAEFDIHVAQNLYMKHAYLDSVKALIRNNKLYRRKKYVYSDIDFQLMGYIVEEITGLPLNEYVQRAFYNPLGMMTTGFNPRKRFPLSQIVPTECEKNFREQCLHGDVHDPRSALVGGRAGHAGLFSDAYDLGVLLQMLLNGGTFAGQRYLKTSTIDLFTSYQSKLSRRGIGWDKPTKAKSGRHHSYPSKYCSPKTFGHYGFTGTAVWVDPEYHFVYVFLSNRVNPKGGANRTLEHLHVRSKVQNAFYKAMGAGS